MALLSERQRTAERLTRELQALGATVTNVLPLGAGQPLKFWISDYKKNALLQQLKEAGYEPLFIGMVPQIDTATYSMGLVNSFELSIPADRQPVHDDRVIPKDNIKRNEPANSEAKAILKEWYGR